MAWQDDPVVTPAADQAWQKDSVVSPSSDSAPDETLSDRVKKFLFTPEGAQTTREAIQGAVESVPQMALDTAKMGYKGLRLATGDPEERARIMEEALAQAKAQGEQTSEDIQSPFGTPEFLRGAGQLGMMAAPGLEFLREMRAPEGPLERPSVQAEEPPVEAPPPAPVSSEIPSASVTPDWFQPKGTPMLPPVEAPSVPPPTIGTPLKPVPLLGPEGTTAADVAAAQAQPITPPAPIEPVAPEPYTPEAAAARSQQPSRAGPPPIQGPSEPVGGNVAGFEKVYGQGEIPAGETVSSEDAWDTAQARAQSGKSQPYGFVDRARTGAITPEEMGDLIYEHHRLVERAAGMEGKPEYGEAAQAAKDFAANVLKPAETAWHQKGMVMQIERPVNLNTFTGMDQLMQSELGRGIKPSEAPKFTRMAEDVKNGQEEVSKAVERSDAKVRARYAKVPDIPIEEAVARVKQMLKDCM